MILKNKDRPAGLALTRQAVPTFPRGEDGFADTSEVAKGGYILKDSDGTPDVILIGTGSEVQYIVTAQQQLADQGIAARVVSMPCREWFDGQDQDYKDSVIPPDIKARVSIEAGVGSVGVTSSVTPGESSASITTERARREAKLFKEFGFTSDTVVAAAQSSIDAAAGTTAPTHPAASGTNRARDLEAHPGVTIS